MDNNVFKNVGIEIQPMQESLFLGLIKILKEKYNSNIHLYVRSPEEEKHYSSINNNGLFNTVTNDNIHVEAIQTNSLVEKEVINRAREYEKLLGEPVNRLALSNRQLGYAFSVGAYRFPFASYAKQATNNQLLHAVSELIAFWQNEIKEKELTLLIDGNKIMSAVARVNGVPYRRFSFSRYQNYCYWASNEFLMQAGLEEEYQSLSEWSVEELSNIYSLAEQKYKFEKRSKGLKSFTTGLLLNMARYSYYKLKGIERAKAISLMEIVVSPFRYKNTYNELVKIANTTLDDLAGKQFIYYPLQKEPEVAMAQVAPEFLSQQATILSLARDLPAGVILAVKENPSAIGRRSKSFYHQIDNLKNVVFLSLDTNSISAIKQAEATITIAGTASMEAAIMGRRSITFSKNVNWSFLPHTKVINTEQEYRSVLEWAIDPSFDFEKARSNGARFLTAIKNISMDMSGFGRDDKGKFYNSEENVIALYEGLCKSFDIQPLMLSGE